MRQSMDAGLGRCGSPLSRAACRGKPPACPDQQVHVVATLRDTVEKICNCYSTHSGISVDWMEGNRKNIRHFTHTELAAMTISVPDLLCHPELFRIDLPGNRIWLSQVGRGAY